MNVFSRFNDFLNYCVDYLDNRVFTGKFIGDIRYELNRYIKFNIFVAKRIYTFLQRSKIFRSLIIIVIAGWDILMTIPLFNRTVQMIVDMFTIVITNYSEIFIIFTLTFTSSVVLLNWFQSAIILFFVFLIPVILLNNYLVSALYYNINDRDINGRISFWQDIKALAGRFASISTPLIIESALILESFVAYFLIIFSVCEIYNALQISWSGSILFWFIFILLSFILVTCLFTVTLIMQQTFFAMLLNRVSLKDGITQSIQQVERSLPYYLFFNFIFYFVSTLLIWKAVLSSLYIGFTLGLYSALSLGTLLAFLLYRQFENTEAEQITQLKTDRKNYIVMIIIIAGFINFLLIASLFIKEYEPILSFIQAQQDNYLAQQEMKQYDNKPYGYSLVYPKNWTLYKWSSSSVTFYNNYTGTLTGGTWLNITVSPYNENYFGQLYYSQPGIIGINTQSGDILTKVTDTTIQNFPTVNYTYIQSGIPYKQYETHYLIHKDNYQYDISFVSLTNDVASYNTNLFQKIISSVKFTN